MVLTKKQLSKKILAIALSIATMVAFMPMFGNFAYAADEYDYTVTSPTSVTKTYTGEALSISSEDLPTITIDTGAVLHYGTDFTASVSTNDVTDDGQVFFETTGSTYGDKTIAPITLKVVEPAPAEDTYYADVEGVAVLYAGEQANPLKYVADAIKANTVVIKNETEPVDFTVEAVAKPDNTTAKGYAGEEYSYTIKVDGVTEPVYTGEVEIQPFDLSKAAVATKAAVAVDYTGASQTPNLGVLTVEGFGELAADQYQATAWSNNINAGTAKATIVAKDTANFDGSADVAFTINPVTVNNPFVDFTPASPYTYNGKVQKPSAAALGLKAYFENTKLSPEIPAGDYQIKYETPESKNVGKYKISIEASDSGNVVIGSVTPVEAYEIVAADMATVEVTQLTESIIVGTDVVADFATYFKVMLGDVELQAGVDFDATYKEGSKDALGNVKLNLKGKSNLTGEKDQTYENTAKVLAPVYTSAYTAEYDGTAKKPTEGSLGEVTKKDAAAVGPDKLAANQYEIQSYQANMNAGTAIAVIEGKGEYVGQEANVEFTITPTAIGTGLTVTDIAEGAYYTGCVIEGATVKFADGTALTADDCTVTAKTIADGYLTAVTVTGIGNYEGTCDVTGLHVPSERISLNAAVVEGDIPAGLTDVSQTTLQKLLKVKVGDAVLTNDVYNIEATGTYELGKTLTLTLTPAKEEIKGSLTVEKTVVARDINKLKDAFTVADGNVYTGQALQPAVAYAAQAGVVDLVKDKDYTLTYANNTNAGNTAKVTVAGKGNYEGSFDIPFAIAKATLTAADFQISTEAVTPAAMEYHAGPITVLEGLKVVPAEGKDFVFTNGDYTLTLVANQTDVAKGAAVKYDVKFAGTNYEEVTINDVTAYTVKAKQIAAGTAQITLANENIAYTGKDISLEELGGISVKYDGVTLAKDTDFTAVVKGVTNKVTEELQPGEVAPYVEVTFAGNYAGLDKKSFYVVALTGPDFYNLVFKDTADEYYYDGTPKVQEVSYIGKKEEPAADTYSVKYFKYDPETWEPVELDSAPTDAGEYRADMVTSEAYGAATFNSKDFEILPKNITKTEFDKMASDLKIGKTYMAYYSEEDYSLDQPELVAGAYMDQFEIVEYWYKEKTWNKDTETGVGVAIVILKEDANFAYDGEDAYAEIEFELYDHEDVSDFRPADFYTIDPQTYTGKALTPELKATRDLPVEYAKIEKYGENINASTMTAYAHVVVTVPEGVAKYRAGTFEGDVVFTINPAPIADQTITVAKATYAGKAVTPKVTIKDADGALLTLDKDYKVVYSNNKKAGKGTATITGIKNYTGETDVQFTINKGTQKITKITPAKKTYKADKKTGKLAAKKTFTLKATATPKKGGGKVTFKKANKVGKTLIKVSKAGKVTVKKGLKKGTYKVKVKATKAANANYKKATKTVIVQIIVK